MDITIQMRSIELLTKFLKHDLKNVPAYGYTVQKAQLGAPKTAQSPLPRSTPEREGVSSRDVERLYRMFSDDYHDIAPHSLMILRHGRVISEGYWTPYNKETPHMLFSMSKSIVSTAIGIAVDEGLLSIDEKLVDIFPDESAISGLALPKFLKEHRVRHLLTMSTGVRFNEVGSMLDDKWVKMFMQSLPKFDAGAAFEYNSLNTYMLAAIIRKKTGTTLSEYLTPRLYEPLGISTHSWEMCPQGTEKGGWGLSLTVEDSAKIGQLYLDKGVYGGRRVVSEEWIAQATRKQIETPNGESKNGYGFQIWMDARSAGAYSFRGVYGQYVLVMPELDMVVATYGGSPYMLAQTDIEKLVCEGMRYVDDEPMPDNPVAYESLQRALSSLCVKMTPRDLLFDVELSNDAGELSRIADALDGREYRIESNNGGLFPMSIQSIHGNYTMGTDILRFKKTDDGELDVTFYEYAERNTVRVSAAEPYCERDIAARGEFQRVAVESKWRLTPDGIYIRMILHFVETPFARIVHIKVRHREISVAFDESPTVEESVQLLFSLLGISKMSFMKGLLAAGRKENVENLIKRSTAPSAAGTMITQYD